MLQPGAPCWYVARAWSRRPGLRDPHLRGRAAGLAPIPGPVPGLSPPVPARRGRGRVSTKRSWRCPFTRAERGLLMAWMAWRTNAMRRAHARRTITATGPRRPRAGAPTARGVAGGADDPQRQSPPTSRPRHHLALPRRWGAVPLSNITVASCSEICICSSLRPPMHGRPQNDAVRLPVPPRRAWTAVAAATGCRRPGRRSRWTAWQRSGRR